MVPKASKWTGFVAIPVCLLVLAAQWINMMLVVSPEVSDAKLWSLSWIDLGMLLGFLSAFILTLVHRSSKVPMINLADPLLYQSSGH
jgi:hypothetical protein